MKKFTLILLGVIIFSGLFAQDRTNESCVQIPDGGSGNFIVENGKLYRLTIKSCWMSADARIGTYLIYGLNIADVGEPHVLTIAESPSIDWTFSYSQYGTYDANMLINSDGWGDQGLLAIFEDFDCNPSVGVNEIYTYDLVKIYPNPVKNEIQIKLENVETATLHIYDIQGKVVYSEIIKSENSIIDATTFSKGFYLFKIIDDNGRVIHSEKVVKN